MRRQKPCEFCENDNWWSSDGTRGHQLCIEVYPYNCILAVTSFAEGENGETEELHEEVELNFCPRCGRKLETI